MKLLLYARDGTLPSLSGAQGIREWELARHLCSNGIDTWCVSKMFPGRLLPFSKKQGVNIIRMPYYHRKLRPALWPIGFQIWAKILAPDIVHFVIPDQVFLNSVQGFAQIIGNMPCPVISELNFVPDKWAGGTLEIIKASSATLCVSEGIQREVSKHLPSSNTFVLPNGIDFQQFSRPSKESVGSARELLTSKGITNRKILIHVGAIDKHRCVLQIIEAMRIVCKSNADLCLVFLGGGESLKDAQLLTKELALEDRIAFLGRLDHSMIPGFLALANIGIALSHKDTIAFTSPMKIFEYMAAGLPIVTVEGGDIPNYVDETFAFYCDPLDPNSVASAIQQAVSQGREIHAEAQMAAQRYSWEVIAKRIRGRYQELLSRNEHF